MDFNTKNKGQKIKTPNPLEALKDISGSTAKQMRTEAGKISEDFMDQLLGIRPAPKNYSGEIIPGEPLEFSDVMSGRHDENVKAKKQIAFERSLLREEEVRIEKKSNELKMQLTAVREEILILAQKTENLAEETQIAAMQAPIEPGIYHVIFFEKLLEFIKSFRRKIDESAIWLHSLNKRAQRKNAWGNNYKKSGSKYLLSSEHYLQRSAG